MKNLTDLEKDKFLLEDGQIILKNESVSYQKEIDTDFSVEDLEKLKFNSSGQIRVAVTF